MSPLLQKAKILRQVFFRSMSLLTRKSSRTLDDPSLKSSRSMRLFIPVFSAVAIGDMALHLSDFRGHGTASFKFSNFREDLLGAEPLAKLLSLIIIAVDGKNGVHGPASKCLEHRILVVFKQLPAMPLETGYSEALARFSSQNIRRALRVFSSIRESFCLASAFLQTDLDSPTSRSLITCQGGT